MSSGPKRKFNSYQEPSDTMATRPPDQRAVRQRPVPTPETQDLYNKMRQEEEKPSFERIRLQSGQPGFLHPPSPSVGTPTSPSPSCASATRSVTRGMRNMSVSGDHPRPKKQRAGRQGPLPGVTKLRAALMRKLGVCEPCRERRVKCSHYDLSLFEAAYQETKRAADLNLSLDLQRPGASPFQPRFGDSNDILGVGGNPTLLSPHTPQGGWDETYVDDPLMEQNQTQQARVAPNPSSLYIFGGSAPAIASTGPQYPAMPEKNLADDSIIIGRQTTPFGLEWDCAWGSDGADWVSSGELEPCSRRFSSLNDLEMHFATCHAPFHSPCHTWQCVGCGFHSLDHHGPCLHCSQNTWRQKCCWAYRSHPSISTSGPFGRVASEDGSPSNHSGWTNQSAQFMGQTGGYNSSFLFPSYGAYGNTGGAGQSYYAAQAISSEESQSKTRCPKASSPPRQCCQRSMDMHLPFRPTSCSDGFTPAALFSRAHPTFPWVVAVPLFLLVLIETWRFAGRSCVERHIVSCIIDNSWISVQELSIVCVVAGLVASWLFLHVRYRWHQRQRVEYGEGQRYERCYMRDVLWTPMDGRDGAVGVTAG